MNSPVNPDDSANSESALPRPDSDETLTSLPTSETLVFSMSTAEAQTLAEQMFQRRMRHLQAQQFIRQKRRQLRISIILFVLTFASTFLVGASYWPLEYVFAVLIPRYAIYLHKALGPGGLDRVLAEACWNGLMYSGPLMMILLFHEMGHYLQSVRYRVPASLPYFIPMPLPPMGTMGAVIFQGQSRATRKQLFDIAVSGPLAGLLITIPVLWFGMKASFYAPSQSVGGLEFGEPLIIKAFMNWLHGPQPEGHVFVMNQVAFAGWVGILVTAMNLLPVGQLDGGHILYTLIGRKAHYVAYLVAGVAFLGLILQSNFAFTLLLLLLILTGLKHPPTANDSEPLGLTRHAIGWLTLAFLIIGFTPDPIIVKQEENVAPKQQEPFPVEAPSEQLVQVAPGSFKSGDR